MANMSFFPAIYMAVVMTQQYDTTQLARLPLLLLDYAERQGLDRDELMRGAGLSGGSSKIPTTASVRNRCEISGARSLRVLMILFSACMSVQASLLHNWVWSVMR
jgi:hypothetical protein